MDENLTRQAGKIMVWLMKYYPVRIKNVGEQQKADRQTIWDFKDGRAYEQVAQMTAKHFGEGVRTYPRHQRLSTHASIGRAVGSPRTPKERDGSTDGTNGRL